MGNIRDGYLLSAEGVRSDFSRNIDRLFEPYHKAGSPGLNIVVLKDDEVVHQRGYGVANIEHDIPFSADTVLRLGSTSKHLCCTALLVLENQGKLSLGDDVRDYVPELTDYGTPITLRTLATMTSGMPDGLNLRLFSGLSTEHATTRAGILDLQCRQKSLMFAPGEHTTYSNTNYNFLSLVIERVSGQDLTSFLRDHIFAPLGMNHSQLTPFEGEVIANKARGYDPGGDGAYTTASFPIEASGDGGVDSTINDMVLWFRNYRNDKHFGPDYRRRIEQEAVLSNGMRTGYGLGMNVDQYRGKKKVSHAGGMPGFLCDFVYFPDDDLGIILFANVLAPNILTGPDRIADIVLFDDAPKSLTADMRLAKDADPVMASVTGLYAAAQTGEVLEFQRQDDNIICFSLGEAHPLAKVGEGTYGSIKRGSLLELDVLDESENGRPFVLLRDGGLAPVRLAPIAAEPDEETASRASSEDYCGRYYSRELEEFCLVREEDGQLIVESSSAIRPLVWRQLYHITDELYAGLVDDEPSRTNVILRFERNEAGRVSGFLCSLNRVFNQRFTKVTLTDA